MSEAIEHAVRQILASDNLDEIFQRVDPYMMGTFVEETLLRVLAETGINEADMAFIREMSIVAATILLGAQKDYFQARLEELGADLDTPPRPMSVDNGEEPMYDISGLFCVHSTHMTTHEVVQLAWEREQEAPEEEDSLEEDDSGSATGDDFRIVRRPRYEMGMSVPEESAMSADVVMDDIDKIFERTATKPPPYHESEHEDEVDFGADSDE